MKLTKVLTLLALLLCSLATVAARADGGPWRGGDRDDHHDFHPGWAPGWRPGFVPPPPGWGPGYAPPPPGFAPPPGYVFTCFAQNNIGQWFYATSYDPNFAQGQALQFCYGSGAACVATGCR